MKKHILALSISFALASNAFGAQMPEKLIIFGDSLSDNGNILRFTYNQENVYNEYLANYYGYNSPRHDGNFLTKRNQDGPNYALGGAVANDYLGGLQGALSPKLSDEINNYLSRRNTQNQDYKYIFWIGGNDLRLADDDINLGDPNISTDQSQNKKIQGSIEAVETQLKKLLINGKAKFVIVPNAPNIANTPNFTNNFLSDGRIYFDGWKSLLGGRKFLGFGWINKDDVIRFLDDQNNHGRPAKDVIYDAFEFVLRKHYNIPQGKPLTSAAFQELQQWKRQFERVYKAETSLVNTFNQGVDKVIENLKAQHPDVTFIRPNIQLLLDEVMSHYTEFGFNNVSGSAANPFTSAVVGWGAGKGRVAAFEPIDGQKGVKDKNYLWGKGYQFVFADQFHPSPKTHRMIADYIMSLLESESGDPTDLTVRRVSTTPFNSTANNIYHSAEGDGVFHVDMHSNDINKSNLNIFNDGRALFASNGGKIQLTNTNITSQGRLGGIINAELGGKIYLTNGHIDIYRTNPYVAPFGVMVNGQSSEVELNKIKLNTFGKETTAITVGNKATLRLQDSQIKTNGVGANVLNLWDSSATIINSTLNTESEKASGVRVFANDQQRRVSTLAMNGSTITATTYYAIKVAENGTRNAAILNAVLDNSTINGGIFTANQSSNPFQHSQSHFVLSNNSLWNMTKDSNVTSMNLRDSTLDLSQSAENWQAKTLNVNDSFAAQNATIRLGTDLYDDSSATDKIQIHGNSLLNAALYIENRARSRGAETKAGIKIIDLNPNKENGGSLYLAKDVTAGLYQYMLTHGGIGADDQSDWYLTSSYIKQDDKVSPVVIAEPETTQPAPTMGKDRSVASTDLSVEAQSVAESQPVTEDSSVDTAATETNNVVVNQPVVETQPVVEEQLTADQDSAKPRTRNRRNASGYIEDTASTETNNVVATQSVAETNSVVTAANAVEPNTAQIASSTDNSTDTSVEATQAADTNVAEKTEEITAKTDDVETDAAVNDDANKASDTAANAVEPNTAQIASSTDNSTDTSVEATQAADTNVAEKTEEITAKTDDVETDAAVNDDANKASDTAANVAEETADNSPVATSSVTSYVPASQLQRILNNNATLLASLPYISQYLSELHLDYARRNPNVPLWDRQNHLDYWVNVAYAHNRVKGDHFLNLKQNSQILSIGKDVITTKNMVAGLSATYSKTQNSVDNYINCQLGLRCYSGKVTSEMASVNGYYLYNWDNWYAQAVMSVGRVTHKFKNADKEKYKQHGYIASAEQLLGYRYPMNSNWTVYADLGLQESYHHYSAMSVAQIAVDKISEHNINALMNIGTQYRIEKFAFSSNLRLVKNLRDFDRLTMDNTVILDKFAKDSAAISGNARYYFTNNISLFMNIEYLRSLNRDEKRQLNYQAGLNIQF
ncbi:SGNH/GDSL hydrolase family protein [Gallibacterium anatis]|uniref:SGNH/GDSL hydrolase family protein n=1 Tax=Gallibacterium anatis TaxID=750 RepID=UPI0039FC2604